MTREPIMVALFALLQGVPGVVTSSRILAHWSEVPPPNQPALFMSLLANNAVRKSGLPTVWTVDVDVYLYINRSSSDVPDTVLNGILDAIEVVLTPTAPGGVLTLGGLCTHAWIEGSIQVEVGALGQQVLAVVPIRVLVPS